MDGDMHPFFRNDLFDLLTRTLDDVAAAMPIRLSSRIGVYNKDI